MGRYATIQVRRESGKRNLHQRPRKKAGGESITTNWYLSTLEPFSG
jgi:hypothetical protein